MHTVSDLSEDARNIHDRESGKVCNAAVRHFAKIPPLDFVPQYEEIMQHKKNDSGINCGIISKRFWEKVHMYYTEQPGSVEAVFINPPAYFIRHCCDNKMCSKVATSFVFSDKRYVDVYQMDQRLKRYKIIQLQDLRATERITQIMVFGAGSSEDIVCSILESVNKAFANGTRYQLCMVMPTAYFDRRNEDGNVREYILKHFSLVEGVLIDSKAANIAPKKRCMLVLTNLGIQKAMVNIQKAWVSECGKRKTIECDPGAKVPIESVQNGSKTLNALYEKYLKDESQKRKREKAKRYEFTPEIVIWYSISHSGSKFRGKFHFYYYPSSSEKLKNEYARGKKLWGNVSGKVVDTLEQVLKNAEELLFTNQNLAEIVRNALKRNYGSKAICLKSFWYLYLPELEHNGQYDEDYCAEFFLDQTESRLPIYSILVGKANQAEIMEAIDSYFKEEGVSYTQQKKLLEQLRAIFNMAVRKKYYFANPLDDIIEEMRKKKNSIHSFRGAAANRSLSDKEEHELQELLIKDPAAYSLKLAFYTKYYTGLSCGELCGLTLQDYRKIPHRDIWYLCINKKLPQTGIAAVVLESKWCCRLMPVVTFLNGQLGKHCREMRAKGKQLGLSEEQIDQLPLFCTDDLTVPMRTRKFSQYCADMIKKLNRPRLVMTIDSDDGDEDTDLWSYKRDLLQANFDFKAIEKAGLNEDELNYCMGRKPSTVVANNYIDATYPELMLSVRTKLDRWVARNQSDFSACGISTHSFDRGVQKHVITTVPDEKRNELCIELNLPDNGSVLEFEFANRFGFSVNLRLTKER